MLSKPKVLLFDWHGTLVDTSDAMFETMEDMLPQLEELDLVRELVDEEQCLSADDVKLVRYIRIYRRLHPKTLAERRVSRTEIFNAIFGDNTEAKTLAHNAYNACYRQYYGKVKPFQNGITDYLKLLKNLSIKIGVVTNRSREFLDHELALVAEGKWSPLLDVTICADEIVSYKPDPDCILSALDRMGEAPGEHVWYIGDSATDMLTGNKAGVTSIFYNSALLDSEHLADVFLPLRSRGINTPSIVDDFEALLDLLEPFNYGRDKALHIGDFRKGRRPARIPLPPRIEPDWHPSVADLNAPKLLLFDWHATLVDTLDAMYHAVDDVLPELGELGLVDKLVPEGHNKTPEDAKLVEYVRTYRKLHPKVRADRKISRTDIFEVLFGENNEAKKIAHKAFNRHYRNHFGEVYPFEPKVRLMLEGLRELGLDVGVITNRDREFFEHELSAVEGTGWAHLFNVDVCGDDTIQRKPHPDQLILAAEKAGYQTGKNVWYVGDSTTDIIAATKAGMTSVFFNGAQWDINWLEKIFPGNQRFPYKPEVVVNDFAEFWALTLACVSRELHQGRE